MTRATTQSGRPSFVCCFAVLPGDYPWHEVCGEYSDDK